MAKKIIMEIHYHTNLKDLSRKLRKRGILSETLLWQAVKGKKMRGYLFTRQKPIDKFIADFYCAKLKLVIEIDGYSHEDKFEKDKTRQKKLESLGLNILRFSDKDVRENINSVLQAIDSWIVEFEKGSGKQPPSPLNKGGQGVVQDQCRRSHLNLYQIFSIIYIETNLFFLKNKNEKYFGNFKGKKIVDCVIFCFCFCY
jgi:very-short-patch-repair endonuclease